MTVGMRWGWVLGSLAAIVIVLLAYAWVDGGRQPLRQLAEPVAVPELPR